MAKSFDKELLLIHNRPLISHKSIERMHQVALLHIPNGNKILQRQSN